LEYFTSNKNIKYLRNYLIPAFLAIVISSCNPTKYVPKGETLLEENRIIINTDSVKKSEIMPYIKQKPNKRIFGLRFHLALYDLSNLNRNHWPHNWLRNIGEEPVLFDPYATAKSKDQIKSYLSSKGYFDGQVMETIETANRKSKVFYNIDLKPAYTIRNIFYDIADTGLIPLIMMDTINSLIEKGKPYDVDLLQVEQARLERFIRDRGFYSFSGDNIYFRIDSTIGNRQVNIFYGVKKQLTIDSNNNQVLVPNSPFKVRNIFIYPDFIPKDVLTGGAEYQRSLDTIDYRGYTFITNLKNPTIKYDVIVQALYLKPGKSFNVSDTEMSQSHLMSFKTYRLVNIRFTEPPGNILMPDNNKALDGIIQLTPMSKQSFTVELEGTNSGGNLGGALNLIYQNKNLFHGAEQFNLKLKGAYETFSQDTSGISSTQEYGVETSLRLPMFLFPFLEKERFIKDFNPTTTIQVAYNYQNLPVYTRTVANATFGYLWKSGEYRTHMVNPLQVNMVKIPFIDPDYYKNVIEQSTYLINSYKDVLIAGGSYSFIFNNQKIKKSRDFWFIRFNAEAAGNLLYSLKKVTNSNTISDSLYSYYSVLGQPFAQFFRTDIDIRYNIVINEISTLVYRGFFGIGIPYRNSVAMPFEKQYFEGGASGIRGWQVRSLGPGSYIPPESKYINQTGDIKFEANVEYRFKLFWILEGAVFVDAGNIWAIKDDIDRPGAQFKLNKFYKDLAVGTGFGMRYDLKFVVLRTDLGFKLRDPRYEGDQSWSFNRPYTINHNNIAGVISIGYPF
jgi:outer membrane protein assembly factor BamA